MNLSNDRTRYFTPHTLFDEVVIKGVYDDNPTTQLNLLARAADGGHEGAKYLTSRFGRSGPLPTWIDMRDVCKSDTENPWAMFFSTFFPSTISAAERKENFIRTGLPIGYLHATDGRGDVYLEMAAEMGLPEAQYILGLEKHRTDAAQSIEWAKRAAQAGHCVACYFLCRWLAIDDPYQAALYGIWGILQGENISELDGMHHLFDYKSNTKQYYLLGKACSSIKQEWFVTYAYRHAWFKNAIVSFETHMLQSTTSTLSWMHVWKKRRMIPRDIGLMIGKMIWELRFE